MRLKQILQNRRGSDRADALLVMSVLFVPFLFICTGFAMDLTKAVYVKQQYQIMGQDATSSAIRSIDPDGSIRPEAAQIMVDTYRDRFLGVDSSSVNVGNDDNFATNEGTAGVRNSTCTTVNVNGTTYQAPYMVLTLDGGRSAVDGIEGTSSAPRWTSEAYGTPVQDLTTTYDSNLRYYAMEAVIYDTAPNLMLGMFGVPCQQVISEVSSVTFGSQEDLDEFSNTGEDGSTCPVSNMRWAGETTIAWDLMAGATEYRLTTTPGGTTRTTTNTSLSGGDISRSAVGRSWALSVKRGNGSYEACGNISSVGAQVQPTCPTNIRYVLNNSNSSEATFQVFWDQAGANDSIEWNLNNARSGANYTVTTQESTGGTFRKIPTQGGDRINFSVWATSSDGTRTNTACSTGNITVPNVEPASCPVNVRIFGGSNTPGTVKLDIEWTRSGGNDLIRYTARNNNNGATNVGARIEAESPILVTLGGQFGDRGTVVLTAEPDGGGASVSCGTYSWRADGVG